MPQRYDSAVPSEYEPSAYEHLYCSTCALKAVTQHSASGRGAVAPPMFQVVSGGEVEKLDGDVWAVPRAVVVMDGASFCIFHMVEMLADRELRQADNN